MQTLLFIMAFMVLGLISLIFLYVFIKIVNSINDPFGLNNNDMESGDNPDEIKDVPSFRIGFDRGIGVARTNLYKMWVEGGESVIVGSYDEVQEEMDKSLHQLLQSVDVMKEWNTKFAQYIDKKKADDSK